MGCKSNGNCGNSGCDVMTVFDWLEGVPIPEGQRAFDIVEVRFKRNRKGFYRIGQGRRVQTGDVAVVDAVPGEDMGIVSLTGELVRAQMKAKRVKDTHEIRKVIRKAEMDDITTWQAARNREDETLAKARLTVAEHKLDMKLGDVEFQGDGTKCTFYYTAEQRVDFRELVRALASDFKVRIEMRQIGARQESARLGGIGVCGRELCCSTWLSDFRSVSTGAARYQQLSLNPQKLAGQCGKLKCCLNFELDQYKEAVAKFPPPSTKLMTRKGKAVILRPTFLEGGCGSNTSTTPAPPRAHRFGRCAQHHGDERPRREAGRPPEVRHSGRSCPRRCALRRCGRTRRCQPF